MVGILESRDSSGSTPINTSNFIAHYAFENTTGSVIDTQNGFNGTITGAITRGATGLVGNCFDFNGGSISIPHNASFNLRLNDVNKNLAFSFWYKPDAIDADGAWFLNKRGSTGADSEYAVSYFQGNLRVQIWNNDGSQLMLSAPFTPVVGTTYRIDGYTDIATNNITLKVNDVALSGTLTGTVKTFQVTTLPFVIGDRSWSLGVAPVLGLMDEVRIWIGDTVPNTFN